MTIDFHLVELRKKLTALIIGSILFSGHARAASIFETLEMSPGELARAGSLPPVASLASLPASEAERGLLIDALLEPGSDAATESRSCYAAQLLELWGERGRALEILENETADDFDRLHLMRLLYRDGKLDAASEVFTEIQSIAPPIGPVTALPKSRIKIAVQPLIVQENLAEMAEFLAWLQPQCRIGEWRSAVLAQRLNLALHRGTLDTLLAELAGESAITRALADRMLDPDSPLVTPAAGTPVLDLAWLVEIDGCTDQAAPFLREAIRTGAGSDAERSELLRQFIRRFNDHEPRTRLLTEWIERDEEFIRLFTGLAPVMSFSSNLPFEPLCQLAERHPHNAYLNFLAGFNQTSRYDQGSGIVVTRSALDCLERAVVSSPLPVGKPNPDGDLKNQSSGYWHYPFWRDDPARFALQGLAKWISSKKLHGLLYSREDFKALPALDQLRYLDAAGLDLPFMDVIFKTDWRDPANDAYGGYISMPSSYPRQPPQELLERFHALLPEIILGSPQKPAALVAAHSTQPFRILFGFYQRPTTAQELELLRRWNAGLLARGPEFARQVLAAGQRFPGVKLDFELMSEVLGRKAAQREVQTQAEAVDIDAKLRACSWFGPLGLSGFPLGCGPEDYYGPEWGFMGDFEIFPAGWLMPRYPALADLLEANYFGWLKASSTWTTAIRSQLPATSKLAVAYDIAIVTGHLAAPDPASAARAEAHVGAMLKTRTDPYFVLCRATNGIPIKHGKPPTDPAAIEELAKLRDEPTPVRRAAAELLWKAGGERKERLLAVLRYEGSPLPKAKSRPPGPSDPTALTWLQLTETLKASPDLEVLCKTLSDLSDSGQFGPYSVVQIPEVLSRFEKPHHERLMDLLRLEPEPIPGASSSNDASRGPSFLDVRRLHAFFKEQDPAAAATFRALAIERGWAGDDYSGEIAEVLLKDGQREEAIEWLANMVIQRRFPHPISGGPYRFPTMRRVPSDYLLDEYLPIKGLELIARERLALPILAIIEAMPGMDDPVLCGFLKFYDSPSVETFERHLGGLTSPSNPHLSNTLRHRLPNLLSRLKHTKNLAQELKEAATKE